MSQQCEFGHDGLLFPAAEKCLDVLHDHSGRRKGLLLFLNKGKVVRAMFHGDLLAHDGLGDRRDITKRGDPLGEFSLLPLIHLGFQLLDRFL